MAKVSKTTVSKVLNGSRGVAPSTRSRVLAVSAELGYAPNTAARSLRTRRTALVGMSVPMLSEPFGLVAEGVDEALADRGIGLVIVSSRWQGAGDIAALERLRMRGVDGFVVSLADDQSDEIGRYMRTLDRPVTLIDREVHGFACDAVLTDQRPGITQAVAWAVESGNREIGLVTMNRATRPGRELEAAFVEALRAQNLPVLPERLFQADVMDRAFATAAATKLVDNGVNAIIAGPSAVLTAGVLECLEARDLSVPDDIALVAFEEGERTRTIFSPRLRLITRQISEIGRIAGRLCLDRLADPTAAPRVEVVHTCLDPRKADPCAQAAERY